MSLDNILAVGIAARGNLGLLLLGLALSMTIIMIGGSLISVLLGRLPWLTYVGALILLILAGDMLVEDPVLAPWMGTNADWISWGLTALFAGLIVWLLQRKRQQAAAQRLNVEQSNVP